MKINNLSLVAMLLMSLTACTWHLPEQDARLCPPWWSAGEDWIDERDNNVYKTVQIGDQIWMAENLRYQGNELSVFIHFAEPQYLPDGVFYEEAALTENICPQGWKLPSDEDWKELETNLNMPEAEINWIADACMDPIFKDIMELRGVEEKVGQQIKDTLKIIPTGFYIGYAHPAQIIGSGNLSQFWTSDELILEPTIFCTPNLADPIQGRIIRQFSSIGDESLRSNVEIIDRGACVRCIKIQ